MPFVSVTRLRLRSLLYLPGFFFHAVRTQRQVEKAAGFLGGSLLSDRHWTFWTLTTWDSEAAMRGYMLNGPHRQAMPKLVEWCDEASVVHWQATESGVPGWREAEARMRAQGRPSRVRRPSLDHQRLGFAAPRRFEGVPLRARQAVDPAG